MKTRLQVLLVLAALGGLIMIAAALAMAACRPEVTAHLSQREIDDTLGDVSAYLRGQA